MPRRFQELLTLGAVLIAPQLAVAQSDPPMSWAHYSVASANPAQTQITLAHGQPRSDWVLFFATCDLGQPEPRAQVYLTVDTGYAAEGAPIVLTFRNSSAPALERAASVDLSAVDFIGPRAALTLGLDDPVWAYLAAEGVTSTAANGEAGPPLTSEGSAAIEGFRTDCARGATLQPGYVGCSYEGQRVSYDGDPAMQLTLFNDTLAPRHVYFVEQDGNEQPLGVLEPGTNAAIDTRRGHSFIFRDAAGACTSMLAPEAEMSVFLLLE